MIQVGCRGGAAGVGLSVAGHRLPACPFACVPYRPASLPLADDCIPHPHPHPPARSVQAFRERIVQGQVDFGTLATTESHCSSAQRGGDLGEFG